MPNIKQQEHLTKQGEPDHRYKENQDDEEHQRRYSDKKSDDDSLELADIPTKHDGTADMRYAQSKEAAASGLISKEEVLEDVMDDDNE